MFKSSLKQFFRSNPYYIYQNVSDVLIFSASANTTSCSSVATAESFRRWASRRSPWSNWRDRTLSDSTTCPNASPTIWGMFYSPKTTGRMVSFRRREPSERPTVVSSNVADRLGFPNVGLEAGRINQVIHIFDLSSHSRSLQSWHIFYFLFIFKVV